MATEPADMLTEHQGRSRPLAYIRRNLLLWLWCLVVVCFVYLLVPIPDTARNATIVVKQPGCDAALASNVVIQRSTDGQTCSVEGEAQIEKGWLRIGKLQFPSDQVISVFWRAK